MRNPLPALLLALSVPAVAQQAAPSPPPPGHPHHPMPARAEALAHIGIRARHDLRRGGHPASDRDAALRQNAAQVTRVRAALKAAGAADRDVQTLGVSLSPHVQYDEGQPPRIISYQASNRINVKLREASRMEPLLDALAASGASQISSPGGVPLY